jgi:murein DD-endopeptidase MepM/ murein hydrolase activator NlpD
MVPAGQKVEALSLKPINPTLQADVRTSWMGYLGSPQTIPDETVRYAMPFGGETPRLLEQGIDGKLTHFGIHRFAFDFKMPIGTPVLAARDGTVLSVADGFPEGSFNEKLKDRANEVVIAHADSTFAAYGHLSSGILVTVGQRVVRGQRLGLSGNSGYSQGPHLHFQVGKVSVDMEGVTIPIRFDDGTPAGLVPEQGKLYGPGSEHSS